MAPLRQKAKAAEARLAKLAAERTRLEATLADPEIYSSARKSEVIAAQNKLAAIRRLEQAAADWLAAEEALESATT
ncbi:MAG: hypothetical protein ACREYF_22285 [Gammaproteobacteria bacterium]